MISAKKLTQKLSAILNTIPESSFPNLLSDDVVIPFPLFSHGLSPKSVFGRFFTCQNAFFILESNLRKLLFFPNHFPNFASDFLCCESRFCKYILNCKSDFLNCNLPKQLSQTKLFMCDTLIRV